jgi:hypothetical protein
MGVVPHYPQKGEARMTKINVLEVAPWKGDLPFNPYLHSYLHEHSCGPEGRILLSPQRMTDKEIDESIDYLIGQLEKARKTAKSKLKKEKERAR